MALGVVFHQWLQIAALVKYHFSSCFQTRKSTEDAFNLVPEKERGSHFYP